MATSEFPCNKVVWFIAAAGAALYLLHLCATSQQQKVGKQHQLLPGQRLPEQEHAHVPSHTAQVFSCRVEVDACAVRDAQSGDQKENASEDACPELQSCN